MFIVALITERHEYDGEETSLSANNPQIFSTRDERVFQNSASYFENHVKPMLPVIFSQNENEIKTPVIYDIEFEPELQKILWKLSEPWWTMTPSTQNGGIVQVVFPDGAVRPVRVEDGNVGVRPICRINLYEIERSAVVQDIANAMRRYNISAKDIETLIA